MPCYPGRKHTWTQDDKKRDCVQLRTWMELRTGQVFALTTQQNRSEDFICGMNVMLRQLPRDQRVHIILDNVPSHVSKWTRAWLRHHPRVCFYDAPASCLCLNLVEGFFSILTRSCLRDGVSRSLGELVAAPCTRT